MARIRKEGGQVEERKKKVLKKKVLKEKFQKENEIVISKNKTNVQNEYGYI